jgi:N-acetylneuraminate synthase
MRDDTTHIICEVGMNHMGDTAYADEYLKALEDAQPDGVTFQVREREWYKKGEVEASIRLSDDYYRAVAKRLRGNGIQFGISLCDVADLAFFEGIGTDFYKILSKDINNAELVSAVLATGKPVYVSTGMSSEDELELFLAGLGASVPQNLSLIHTQLSYEDADTNLRAIGRLRERFGVPVAFGSHSTDVHALYAALGFSPSALFFYVKGERAIKHRDETHAVPLSECPAVIVEIRRLETMLGDGIKKKMENSIPDQTHGKK